MAAQDYLKTIIDTLKKIFPDQITDEDIEKVEFEEMTTPEKVKNLSDKELGMAWLRLVQWYNSAKDSGRAVEDFVNAGKFVMDEMMERGVKHDMTLDLAQAISRLGKAYGLSKNDLEELPDEVMIVPDFVSIVGSSVRSDSPNDIDVLYRADNTERGDFIIRWENGYLALRNTLRTIRPDLAMHEIFNPQGSRESQWLPAYHLVLRKSNDELRMVKEEAPVMPGWENYLPIREEDCLWIELGCGSNKADGFIGLDKELYPGVDIRTDLERGIPFNDSSVNVVRANHFIEHMPNFENIMNEIARVLTDGGICIMTIPSTDGAGAYAHPDHKLFMNKSEFQSKIADMGQLDPKVIVERQRDRNGIPCMDIDAILTKKAADGFEIGDEVKILVEHAPGQKGKNATIIGLEAGPAYILDFGDGVPHKWYIKEELELVIKKGISPLKKFTPTKPQMAGYTEAFELDDLAKWASTRYPISIEQKYNGFRSIIGKKGQTSYLWFEGEIGTNQIDKFPDIKDIIGKISEDFVIDTDIGMERNGRRLPRQDLMTFNADKPELKQDDVVIITIFDILYRGNEDLTEKRWSERRLMLEQFFNKNLKGEKNFQASPWKIIKDEAGLKIPVHWAFGFPMSEGLVAKALDSVYMQGGTSEWFKLKRVAELKVIVLDKKRTKAGAYNYTSGLIPSSGYDYSNVTEFKGKNYVDLGKTFSTSINAELGEILTVTIIELLPETEGNVLAWVGARVKDIDKTRKEPYTVEQSINISERAKVLQKNILNIVPSMGKPNAEIAFVGASPGRIDQLRGEPIVGPSGETFNEQYLKPLGLSRNNVFITNTVPILLLDNSGYVREPSVDEVNTWREWLDGELERANPKIIVALGQMAKRILGDEADFVMPHPMAIRRFGDSGEIGRKIKQIKLKLDEMNKGLPSVSDVHIPSTYWRSLKKVDSEGGDETRSVAAVDFWNKNWQTMYPVSGKGEYTYQHHWRGLSEEESKLSEDELLKTDHSIHGDLRFTASKGEDLWGFSVFIGQTAENRDPKGDRLIMLPQDKNIQGTFKLAEPLSWLTVARGKPYIAAPGEPGSTSKTYSKFFEQDHGAYEIGVWKQHLFELFIKGGKLKGRYLIEFAPIEKQRIWLIDRPEDQTPLAESKKLDAEIKDQKGKGRDYIVWSMPGKEPIAIKLGGKAEKGFVMADELMAAMGQDDDPWKAYETMPKSTTKEIYAEIIKADAEKQLVYGVVLEPGEVDAQNDTIGPEEIERAAHVYMQNSRVIGDAHKAKAKAKVVESYIAPMDMILGGQKVKKGTWIMVVKINDSEMWKLVKENKYTGFSIGGYSRRIPVDKPAPS